MKSIIHKSPILIILLFFNLVAIKAQEVEVQGELKVTQMAADETADKLVIRKTDGTLGTRMVSSLPPPPPPIDSTRNLASDYELAKHLCECPTLPPFLIQKLLESGYTEDDLLGAGVLYGDIVNAQFTCGDTLVDNRNGKMYATVRIGGQCWMAENLNIGMMTPGANAQTDDAIIEKYCYDDDAANCDIYGGLYQWNEMMQYGTMPGTQGVCPTGWHLPTDNEFKTLEKELGMTKAQADITGLRGANQGSKLASNEPLWTNGVLDQNSTFGTSGFMALPGGDRVSGAFSFFSLSEGAFFWTSSLDTSMAWNRRVIYSSTKIGRQSDVKILGMSVRCVKD